MHKLFLLLPAAVMLMTLVLASHENEWAVSSGEGAARAPHGSWSFREVLRTLVREEQRRGILEEEGVAVLRRIQNRQDITASVIARRMTLREAAAHFRSLNRELRQNMSFAAFRGASEEERLCRQVTVWVENALRDEPGRQAAEVTRLETELKRYLRGEDKSGMQ